MQQLIIKDLDFKYKNFTIPIFDSLNIEFDKGVELYSRCKCFWENYVTKTYFKKTQL